MHTISFKKISEMIPEIYHEKIKANRKMFQTMGAGDRFVYADCDRLTNLYLIRTLMQDAQRAMDAGVCRLHLIREGDRAKHIAIGRGLK